MSRFEEHLGSRVVKDLYSIRKKGVHLERVFEFLIQEFNLQKVGVYSNPEYFMYHENYYVGDNDVRVAWASALLGLPSLSISVKTRSEWIDLREKLRAAGLVRSEYRKQKKIT